MIAEYEDENRDPRHASERIYGLNLQHKHLPEMEYVCGLTQPPVFVPVVGDFTRAWRRRSCCPAWTLAAYRKRWKRTTRGQRLVTVAPFGGDEPVIYANTLAGRTA